METHYLLGSSRAGWSTWNVNQCIYLSSLQDRDGMGMISVPIWCEPPGSPQTTTTGSGGETRMTNGLYNSHDEQLND